MPFPLPFWPTLLGAIFGSLILFAISLWLGRKALLALRRGVAITASRAEYQRQENPLMYWLTVNLQILNAAACVLIGLALLATLILLVLG